MTSRLVVTAIALVALTAAALPAAASAAPKVDGEFALTSQPRHLALGPDGNVWVALGGPTNDIARVTPAGVVTEFNPADVSTPTGIAAGPDGNMWVTQSGGVAKFAPANPNGAQKFAIAAIADPRGIVAGPDNNLWTASGDKVLRIPPATPATPTPFTVAGMGARGIARGTDGRLYVADFGGGRIIAVTTAGVVTPTTVGGGPQEVAGGAPGGLIAYANPGAMPQVVGRISPGGMPQTTPSPMTDPFGLAYGADRAYWFANFATSTIGRLTTAGAVTTLPGLSAGSGPRFITRGAGETLWVSLEVAKKVARITGVQADATRPAISELRVSPSPFRVGARSTQVVKAAPRGTTISYRLSEKASVRISIQRRASGRRSGGACVAPTPALRNAPRCDRYLTVVTLRRTGYTGRNTVPFSGRVNGRAFAPGGYRARLKGTDRAGNASLARTYGFRIVAR